MKLIKILIIPVIVLFVNGCAFLQSKEVAIACQAADAGTTIYAKHIGASEDNPVLVNNNILILFKLALIWLIESQWDKMDDFGKGAVTIVSCIPVVNNVAVIRQQQRYNRE